MRFCSASAPYAWLAFLLVVVNAACTGEIVGPTHGDAIGAASASGNGAGAVGASGAAGSAGSSGASGTSGMLPVDGCALELSAPRAVLSPLRQYQNVLRDLLGPDAVREEDAEVEIEFEVIDRGRMTTSMLDQVLRLAERASESVRSSATTLLGCNSLADRMCVRGGLEVLARRAFKRPPASAEIDAVMEVYDNALTLSAGLPTASEDATLTALMAVLTAPSTVYRTEFEAGTTGQPLALTAHERAAAIAALLLDSIPDEELMAAADSGALMQPVGLTGQVTRLLALPRVQEHLTDVMLTAFKVPKLFQSPKDEALFPEYTADLQLSMYEETRRFLDNVLFTRKAPLSELMLSRRSFVNAQLADLYGIAYPGGASTGDEFVEVELPTTRSGLLTQASVLSVLSRTDKTSVVARGLFVRGALVCLPKIAGPPESVQAQVNEQLSATSTQAELAEYRAMTSPCMGCHSQFDRFGLVLESFDPIGRERAMQPAPTNLDGLALFTGEVANPAALAAALAQDSQFVDCLTERMLSYALSEASETGTTCIPDSIASALHAPGANLSTLVSAVVTHPSFAERGL